MCVLSDCTVNTQYKTQSEIILGKSGDYLVNIEFKSNASKIPSSSISVDFIIEENLGLNWFNLNNSHSDKSLSFSQN